MPHPFRTLVHQVLDYHDGGQTRAERVVDGALNVHVAHQVGVEATNAPAPDPELTQLHPQLADKERLIASLEGTIASKEEIISLLRGGYNRPN